MRQVEGCSVLPPNASLPGGPLITSDFGGSSDFKSLADVTAYLSDPAGKADRAELRSLAAKTARVVIALPPVTSGPAAAPAAAAAAAAAAKPPVKPAAAAKP